MSDGDYKIQTTADEEQWRWKDIWQPPAPELCSPGLRARTIKMAFLHRKDLGWSVSHADPEAKIMVNWLQDKNQTCAVVLLVWIQALASNRVVTGIMWSEVKGPHEHEWPVWGTRHSSIPRLYSDLCLLWVASLSFIILFWQNEDLYKVMVSSHTNLVIRVLHWVR